MRFNYKKSFTGLTLAQNVETTVATYNATKSESFILYTVLSESADALLSLDNIVPVFTSEKNTYFDFPKASGYYYPIQFQADNKSPSDGYLSDIQPLYLTNGQTKRGNTISYIDTYGVYPINLYADLVQSTGSSVNQLRSSLGINIPISNYGTVTPIIVSVDSGDVLTFKAKTFAAGTYVLNIVSGIKLF